MITFIYNIYYGYNVISFLNIIVVDNVITIIYLNFKFVVSSNSCLGSQDLLHWGCI